MLQGRLGRAEKQKLDRAAKLKRHIEAIKAVLEEDEERVTTLMIQRQFGVILCRKSMKKAIERRKKAATAIQRRFIAMQCEKSRSTA